MRTSGPVLLSAWTAAACVSETYGVRHTCTEWTRAGSSDSARSAMSVPLSKSA
jgi:hypothetical protein